MRLITLAFAALLPLMALATDAPKSHGTVAAVHTGDAERDEDLNGRLHFCLFENGKHDLLYVGTKYGMWSDGWIELTLNDEVVFSGKVPGIAYEGVLLDVGDVIEKPLETNIGIEITKVKGWFK